MQEFDASKALNPGCASEEVQYIVVKVIYFNDTRVLLKTTKEFLKQLFHEI